jgi:hypothetical protein
MTFPVFSTWKKELPIKFTDETQSNVTIKHRWQQKQKQQNIGNNDDFKPPVNFCANPGYTGALCDFRKCF